MELDYNQAMDYLGLAMKFGSRLGLERMQKLMELLGDPGMDIPCIHIAGTNGKGSVSTMTANAFAAAGFKTGLYTSPFINRFTERIRIIDGRNSLDRLYENEEEGEISKKNIAKYISVIKEKIEIMLNCGFEHPTEFEIVTAAAFMHFKNQKCEYMVLETGLGGRLDSTNIVPYPEKCIITAIGYDHMDRLGNTIGEIAYEKAGIIKRGAKIIVGDPYDYTDFGDASVIRNVIEKKCNKENISDLKFISGKKIRLLSYGISGQKISYESASIPSREYVTALLGGYQPFNCMLVIEACYDVCGYDNLYYGISKTKWPARLEILRSTVPEIILDGAHNDQGVKALVKTIEKLFAGRNIVFVCGVMQDKNYSDMIKNITESSKYNISGFFCTKPDNPRALDPEIFKNTIKEILDKNANRGYNITVGIFCENDPAQALLKAFDYASENDSLIVAFGSLYMAGVLRNTAKLYLG